MNIIENDNLTKIIIDAQNNVEGAFELLYKETIKYSYGIASMLLKNEEDIEDALQNSYMYVAKSIGDLKNPESFERWLGVIVKHECQKHIAKHKRVTDIFSAVIESKEFDPTDEETFPFDLIERKEISEAVKKIVNRLPDDKRACVVLYYFGQNSLPEIAEILGIPEGTVKSRLYNARKTLEKEFKKLQKKDDTLLGISVIPLVAAFLAYQAKNIVVPVSIAEGAAVCIAAAEATTAVSAVSAFSAAGGTTAATGTSAAGVAGTAGVTVATKVTAVAVAAAVATGGGVATVNYVENKREAESTTLPSVSVTEEYTTAAAFFEETTIVLTGTTTVYITTETTEESRISSTKKQLSTSKASEKTTAKEKKTSRKQTTRRNTTTNPVTTAVSTTVPETTTKETTTERETTTRKPTTQRPTTEKETTLPSTAKETTAAPTTNASDIYDVSGGVLSEYKGSGGNVSVPQSVNGDDITAIGAGAFAGNSGITSVSMPSTVTKVGQEAFADCTNLKSVSMPSTLQSIGIGAFCGCTSLTSVSIPSGVTAIGDDAFADCASLESIAIPSSVTSIGDNAFGGCGNLTIKCSEGSAAHDYAVENSIEFELI